MCCYRYLEKEGENKQFFFAIVPFGLHHGQINKDTLRDRVRSIVWSQCRMSNSNAPF